MYKIPYSDLNEIADPFTFSVSLHTDDHFRGIELRLEKSWFDDKFEAQLIMVSNVISFDELNAFKTDKIANQWLWHTVVKMRNDLVNALSEKEVQYA